MKTPQSRSWSAPVRVLAVAAAVVSAGLPLIAQSQDRASAQETYRQDRADCMAGNTSQSKADCLYEARSALRDRLNGDPQLDDSNDGQVARAADGTGSTSVASAPTSDTSTMDASAATTQDSSGSELPPQADRN